MAHQHHDYEDNELSRTYRVVIPAAELMQELDAKIAEVQPQIKINGFRPGKVPPAHIKKVYGPSIMREVIEKKVEASTKAQVEKANAKPVSEPHLHLESDLEEVAAGKADLAFDVHFEVMPDFETPEPSAIAFTRPIAPVEDAQVEEALEQLLKANRTFEEKDGAAADGDAVVMDFEGKVDGVAFEGGKAEGAEVILGSGSLIPGFESGLIGVKKGEERTLNVTFPDDYGVETLKGKAAEFAVKATAVKAPKEAVADDAFAKQLGLETIGEVRDALRRRIEAEHTAQSRAKAKRALFDQLDKMYDFALPPGMLDAEFRQIWSQIEADKKADRLDPEDAGKDEETLKSEYKRIAERRVRLGLVLAEVGSRNKVAISDQEVGQAILDMARRFPGQERQVFEAYQKNPQLQAQIRAPLYEDKVVDFLLELAKVTNQTVTREELFTEDGAPGEAAESEAKPKRSKKAKGESAAEPAEG
ncbi:MAG: trigger factor [Hyphomonadaceae bacterium]|nr:trigger factor [Hyphomonadaceae bacterium]